MNTLHKFIIIGISCFCLIDLVFIQSYFFISCLEPQREYSTFHTDYCHDLTSFLEPVFGMAASLGIATIVGIFAFHSPKRTVIPVLALTGLYVFFFVLNRSFWIPFAKVPPDVMRPSLQMWIWNSPLWPIIPAAAIASVAIWSLVVLRKKLYHV